MSYFNESLSGLSTIRAYRQEKSFYKKHSDNMNENKKNLIIQTGLAQWFTISLTFVSFFVNMAAISFCVFINENNVFKFIIGIFKHYLSYFGWTSSFLFFGVGH